MSRVLRVVTRLNVGGPARHALRVAAPLAAAGFESVLVTGTPAPGEGDLIDEARALGLDVRLVPELGRAVHPVRDARAVAALRALVREVRPAIVHTHTAKAGLLGRAAALASGARPVLVHTFHGHVLSGYFAAPTSRLFALLEAALARATDKLVAVSATVRDELLHRHRVGRADQFAVVPPGIDGARTAPDHAAGAALRAALRVAPDELLVGAVGRLAPVKDPWLLLDAYERLLARGAPARLLLVGDGPLAAEVDERLARLPGAVRLPARHDLRAVYGALDALALTSRREGLPQVVAEALAGGVPVVATAVGGVPELVRDGLDGLLVPPEPDAFAAALAALAHDPRRRAAMSAAAAARDWSAHTAEAVAAQLAALYTELLAGAGARASGQQPAQCAPLRTP